MKRIIKISIIIFIVLMILGIFLKYLKDKEFEKIACLNIYEINFILENEANIKGKLKSEEQIKTLFNALGGFNKETGIDYKYQKLNDKEYDIIYKDNNYNLNLNKCKNYEQDYPIEFKNLKENLLNTKECYNMTIIFSFFNLRQNIFNNNITEMNKFIETQSDDKNYVKTFNKDYNNKFYKLNLNNNILDLTNSNGYSYNKNCIKK